MEKDKSLFKRPPVVTVLGHVDHGKTSLLDALRKTDVQEREVGGITQKIGASVVRTSSGRDIVFIDTPGHAAFAKMRSCGVLASDIAILVVAADDGVMPQTKESIEFIKQANIPFVVAITKIDLPSAKIDFVKEQLAKEGVLLEGEGGSIPFVPVSSKTGEGLNDLLEVILLLWDLDENSFEVGEKLKAVVIETSLTKAGPSVSVVVKEGELKLRQEVFFEGKKSRVRGLIDAYGKSVESVKAGYPSVVLGFDELPTVGCAITEEIILDTLEVDDFRKDVKYTPEGDKRLRLILKAESQGAVDAILSSLPDDVFVVSSGVGEVTKNDILLAKGSKALIFTFGLKNKSETIRLSESEGVKIESFDIIYRLIERVEELLSSSQEKILSKAEILAEFPFEGKRVAGCKVLYGEIKVSDKLLLKRGDSVLGEVKVLSLRKKKEEVDKVTQGEEFGVLFFPQLDFRVKDVLILVTPATSLNGK